ncbi:hypothetical protein GP486_007094 [Trichoglossum hirsutum]|uniref:Uncharacterized protein n=1 Tax=Trichoglossum hirsutum TaxID=265104 RepID=A0A9P8IDD3_9PEZI|nr:hypothetical protein GP486_007094 [Trichoglossum hirsutum]
MADQHEQKKPAQSPREPFHVTTVASHIADDALSRLHRVSLCTKTFVLSSISFLPKAFAFTPHPSNATANTEDVVSMIDLFDFKSWSQRVSVIRASPSRAYCIGNLSLALGELGPVVNAETAGAAGALSLLPTAGALIGAPAKELWLLYKLMPLAGVLSMLLSLGGNIVPTQSSDYELKASKFSYGGFIATSRDDAEEELDNTKDMMGSEAERFAKQVKKRADEQKGGRKRMVVGIGVFLQFFWLVVLVAACCFTQAGSVVVWWCKAWGWMLFWYLTVAVSSILENIAGVPFTKQWTIRISKAPSIRISEDAPVVASIAKAVKTNDPVKYPVATTTSSNDTDAISYSNAPEIKPSARDTLTELPTSTLLSPSRSRTDLLANLEAGYNTTGRVIMDPEVPWCTSRVPFYVIISLEGISTPHATFRVISKAVSVGVYAAGTATFASATFITISVALTVLCLVLGAGVFGRVVTMWMASEMMKGNPILHRVVKGQGEAAEYIESILSIPGLTCEVMGHVIVNGRCIKRYNPWLRISTYFGVLAPPYNVPRLAVSR